MQTLADFPKQGRWLGKRVKVCFNYDTSTLHNGEILRDDLTEPYATIIQLDATGQLILATECQFTILEPSRS